MMIPSRWVARSTQIARVLTNFGLASLLHYARMDAVLPRQRGGAAQLRTRDLPLPVRVRLALEAIGPTAIKLAQTLSSRSDLLPFEYIIELRKLQDAVPPFPFEEARKVIKSELGQEIEELFEEFDPEPIASASIAQVHCATLHDGRKVAVKLQRPGLEQEIDTDLEIMLWVVKQVEKHSDSFRRNHLAEQAEEIAFSLRRELNFTVEAHNTSLLREQLADEPKARVPKVIWELSSRRVLTLERMAGAKVTDDEALERQEVSRSEVAQTLAALMLRQVCEMGFFHADPHPGNILIGPAGSIIFLDCGNTTHIPRELREGLVHMLMALLEENTRDVCDEIVTIGAATEASDLQDLYVDVQKILAHYGAGTASDIRLGDVLELMMSVIWRHQIRMPPSFAMLIKTLVVTEGSCLQLDPEFDFREVARKYSYEMLWRQLRPMNLLEQGLRTGREFHHALISLPRQLGQLMTKVQSGSLKVKLEYDEMERPMQRLAAIVDRLAVSIMVSALILAAAWIISSGTSFHLTGTADILVYLIGSVGLALGGWLLVSIMRSGRL